jgi:hypothetical protein
MILSFTQAVVFHRPRQTSIRDNRMMDLRLRASPRHGGSGGTLSNFFVTEPPHKEAPSGAAALLIISDGPTADNRLIITEYYDFYRKIQKNLNARRSFTPTALCSPKKCGITI